MTETQEMALKAVRDEAVASVMTRIKGILGEGVSVPGLEAAKTALLELSARRELFPRRDFPLPEGESDTRTFLIHQETDGGYALYVNSGLPGQRSHPHDHGGSWAIVAAVEGEEVHRLFVPDEDGGAAGSLGIRQVAELVVRPGHAVSLMPEGIHAIHMESDQPILHLHLYGRGFPFQTARRVYDFEQGEVRSFVLEDVGFIEDAR